MLCLENDNALYFGAPLKLKCEKDSEKVFKWAREEQARIELDRKGNPWDYMNQEIEYSKRGLVTQVTAKTGRL